jgi:hypothetical protein
MVPRRTGRRSLIGLGAGALLGALVPARIAAARGLGADERARLDAGEVVRVPLDVELAEGSYFGGVSYAVIPAPLADVMAVLLDPGSYTSIFPLTLEATVVERSGLDFKVFFRVGGRAGTAAYTLAVRRESAGLIRFWLDHSRPHEIADCWGSFRVQPWGKDATLLTYAALLRLDFGLVKLLFSEKIRGFALGTPGLVRSYVMAHRR